ncbi:MAG: TonB family protein [Bradymonadia bacterium]
MRKRDLYWLSIILSVFFVSMQLLTGCEGTQQAPKGIEALPDRFVEFLDINQPDEEPLDEAKPDSQAGAKPDPHAEGKGFTEAESDHDKFPKMRKVVRSKTVLSRLGTMGGDGTDKVVDDLQDGAKLVALKDAFDGATGVAMAKGPGAGRDTRSRIGEAGAGESASVSNAEMLGLRGASSARVERRVRGRIKVASRATSQSGQGELDATKVARVIKRRQGALKSCYEQQLKRNPKLSGKVLLQFQVLESGRVGSAAIVQNSTGSPEFGKCLTDRFRRMRFPRPEGGAASFTFPFAFSPVDGGYTPPTPSPNFADQKPPKPEPEKERPPPEESKRVADKLTEDSERDRVDHAGDQIAVVPPSKFLPRSFYFENTYLAGDAALSWRMKRLDEALSPHRRPYAHAGITEQDIDPPTTQALALDVSLDRPTLEAPGRVFMQVGLRGSERFGWRRPPLEVVLVVDTLDRALVDAAYQSLRKRLNGADHLAIEQVGVGEVMPMRPGDQLPFELPVVDPPLHRSSTLRGALETAGSLLAGEAHRRHRVPGSRMVLLLSTRLDDREVRLAEPAVHALTLNGVITSVFERTLGSDPVGWQLAAAGHGHAHTIRDAASAPQVVEAEFEAIAQVVARLVRLNVRLGPDVELVRVVGSRPLEAPEVKAVKAREVRIDQILGETLGVEADRGDDDDGVQTVIPYFLGGDTHVVLFELWVKSPGAVADVSIQYKDLIQSNNATAHASAFIQSAPRALAPHHRQVRRNLARAEVAQGLLDAATQAKREGKWAARRVLGQLGAGQEDGPLVISVQALLDSQAPQQVVASALEIAGIRHISHRGQQGRW